jgi:hypothetical protein
MQPMFWLPDVTGRYAGRSTRKANCGVLIFIDFNIPALKPRFHSGEIIL